jgi:predicted nucleic acid-binding protein
MIHSVQFKALLDTNVLYPIVIRDLLFWFAHFDMYTPLWSDHIFKEWEKVFESRGIAKSKIRNSISLTKKAFPDATVENYEFLIPTQNLPDQKDNHVLAAAIKAKAELIVNHNQKVFPQVFLNTISIKAKAPDDFITDVIDLNPVEALKAFREMVLNKKNPDLDEFEVLNQLRQNGLKQTANFLHALI